MPSAVELILVASSVMYAVFRLWDVVAKFHYRNIEKQRNQRMEERERAIIEILNRLTPKG